MTDRMELAMETPEQAMQRAKAKFTTAAQAVLDNQPNAIALANEALRALARAQAWAKLERGRAQ